MRHLVTIALFLLTTLPLQAQPLAKQLFGAEHSPSPHLSEPFGSYSRGCLAGGRQLPETGPTWQAMRLSRNRNWGYQETVDFVEDLSRFAATQPGWAGLYIGDMSQPRGGPMLSGHRSHQIGLDADIWMLPAKTVDLTRQQRESISSVVVTTKNEAYVNDNWTQAHFEILREAAKDKRVARIFVSPGIKVQMCKQERGNRKWLRKIRSWPAHNYHFHVRLNCPRGADGCVDQDPPPSGDGCAEAQEWVNNIINPQPPKPRDPNAPKPTPRREYYLADLPQACSIVLNPK
ncbi:MAG: penicillin-insensitive murein endopeptidase [Rhodobacteraceae bacterium]|nr:penicillin-insensitive murein endopeptidase [Paracoccaceae bacterium]MAY44082.1 penicillin-insensitive murein endopeptidase [Paracoccaceae bacterium]QEW23016.1 Penicillin-insensitive murein endopeptidase precursor [Marinibacterium anthonyi]